MKKSWQNHLKMTLPTWVVDPDKLFSNHLREDIWRILNLADGWGLEKLGQKEDDFFL